VIIITSECVTEDCQRGIEDGLLHQFSTLMLELITL